VPRKTLPRPGKPAAEPSRRGWRVPYVVPPADSPARGRRSRLRSALPLARHWQYRRRESGRTRVRPELGRWRMVPPVGRGSDRAAASADHPAGCVQDPCANRPCLLTSRLTSCNPADRVTRTGILFSLGSTESDRIAKAGTDSPGRKAPFGVNRDSKAGLPENSPPRSTRRGVGTITKIATPGITSCPWHSHIESAKAGRLVM
jgi:hypothetical protein